MFLKKYINVVKQDPVAFLVGLSVFFLAVMGTSVHHMSSTVFALLVLISFSVIKDWGKIYLNLSRLEQMFLITLIVYTMSGLLSFYNVDDVDTYYKQFERYFRFSLIIPFYFFLVRRNVSILHYLYVGAVVSGPFLFIIALQHYFSNPGVPAKGYYHHIIFGQLAMLNVGVMLSMLLTKDFLRNIQFIIFISMLCGLAAAVLSQARGVWLVVPIYIALALYYAISEKRISKKSIAVFLIVASILAVFSSVGNLIQQRTVDAVSEVEKYYMEDQYASSLGTRLAMWEIAVDVWKQHPFLGTGPGDFDNEIMSLQAQGEYVGMEVHNSVHNIFIQALVDLGVVGFLALMLVFFVPLRIYYNSKTGNAEAWLVGFVTVLSFAVFGLSESWTLRLSITSVFLVYTVVIVSHINIVSSKSNN